MRIIKNLRIVSKILNEKLPNYKFDKSDLLMLSAPKNMPVFYIGNKNSKDKTLFKHSSADKCYYDVLSKNEMYYDNLETLYQMDSENLCTNLIRLDNLVKIYEKRKEVIL